MLKFLDNKSVRTKIILLCTVLTAGYLIAFIALALFMFKFTGALSLPAEVLSKRNSFFVTLVIIMAVFAVISELLVLHVIRNIRLTLLELKESVNKLTSGDANVTVIKHFNDEIGDLAEATGKMAENVQAQVKVAKAVADGDLTTKIVPRSENDALNKALKQLVTENNETLLSMKTAAGQVSDGSDQVSAASQALAQGSTEQASAIQQINASIDDIANRTRVNADDANNANTLVAEAKEGAELGNKRMDDMIQAMSDINESSENISKIMKVIDDIAFQTNILALNAAVEAARAGVHGKGFAVVADEVRNLAGKSAEAASETAELIENSIAKVNRGSQLAKETAEALREIMDAIDKVAELVGNIASSANEQATVVSQIDQAIGQVSIVVQNNSSTSEECAAASEELSAQALKLKEMLGRFRLDENYSEPKSYSRPKRETVRKTFEKKTDSSVGNTSFETSSEAFEKKSEQQEEIVISLDDGFGKY